MATADLDPVTGPSQPAPSPVYARYALGLFYTFAGIPIARWTGRVWGAPLTGPEQILC